MEERVRNMFFAWIYHIARILCARGATTNEMSSRPWICHVADGDDNTRIIRIRGCGGGVVSHGYAWARVVSRVCVRVSVCVVTLCPVRSVHGGVDEIL